MPAERINPDTVYQPVGGRYTQVTRATGTTEIHVAGTLGLDRDGNLVGEGDMRTQVRVTMENIGKSLEAVGATPADVVRIKIFTLDVDEYVAEGHDEVMAFFEEAGMPASTLLGVTRLADPRFLVEIEVTALLE